MSEEITGVVSFPTQKSTMTLVITGKTSPKCRELLKLLLKKWAKRCGVGIGISGVRALKKAKKKKK